MRGSENLADPAIETLNHAIGLRVFGLDQTVLNAFCLTYLIKRMLAGGFTFSVGDKAIRKLFTIIRQHLGDDKRRLLVDGILPCKLYVLNLFHKRPYSLQTANPPKNHRQSLVIRKEIA